MRIADTKLTKQTMANMKRKIRAFEPAAQPKGKQPASTYGRDNRYSSRAWKILRHQVLMAEPLCRACVAMDRVTAACVVDHVVPVRLGGAFYSEANLQPLCTSCHAVKSAQEGNERNTGDLSA